MTLRKTKDHVGQAWRLWADDTCWPSGKTPPIVLVLGKHPHDRLNRLDDESGGAVCAVLDPGDVAWTASSQYFVSFDWCDGVGFARLA